MQTKYVAFGVSLAAWLGLDQLTKWLVVSNLREGVDTVSIIDGLLLFEHARNTGAAFSMMEGQMTLFAVFTFVAVGVILYMLWQLDGKGAWLQATALGTIASGALGNGIDRMLYASVTDFIRVYTENPTASRWLIDLIGSNAWPTFNVADTAIFVG
ncbi:MAG: signal peptidase II, partial [Myxococcota bacterium]